MNKDFELEKLKIELRHIKGMYAVAQSEVIDASKKVHYFVQFGDLLSKSIKIFVFIISSVLFL